MIDNPYQSHSTDDDRVAPALARKNVFRLYRIMAACPILTLLGLSIFLDNVAPSAWRGPQIESLRALYFAYAWSALAVVAAVLGLLIRAVYLAALQRWTDLGIDALVAAVAVASLPLALAITPIVQ